MITNTVKTSYLQSVFNLKEFTHTTKRSIETARRMMRELPFDAIAFTGTSGAAIAYILSMELNIPLICIRKETEKSHYSSNGPLEGYIGAKRYIIADDFIASGDTVRKIIDTVASIIPGAECVGALMYKTSGSDYVKDISWYDKTTAKISKTIKLKVYSTNQNDQLCLQFKGWSG